MDISMMETVFPFALWCFTSLFTITSPLSTMPVFLTMTQSLDEKERRAVAIRSTLVACCALLLFVLAGQFLFKFFGISTNGFRIVGGIIIFRIGFDMLQAKYTPMNLRKEEIKEYANDVSVAPLGIPLLCGPGAIANAIVLMQEAHSFEMKTALIVAIVLVYVVTFCLLRWAGQLVKFIGETGNNVMMRLMGLILMVIAVECFVSGARPILTEILHGS
ncbi:antibiotic resistance protein MarC [Paraprevotella clara]|jgi:membrane protein, marC family|nr:antibiotic resistance protein MarC [Paraprevotella clara]